MSDVFIRHEAIADRDSIRELTARAFAGVSFSDGTEPFVIDALRAADALVLSLVGLLEGRLVGHVAFSAVGPPTQSGWFALGPVSVEPAFQRRGIGGRLIRAGLAELRDSGANGCVLIGDHRYYRRFGFVLAPTLAPRDFPAAHFQIVCFHDERPAAAVAFHPAFRTKA